MILLEHNSPGNKFYDKNRSYYNRNADKYECASWYYFNSYKNTAVREELTRCVSLIEGEDALSVLEIGPGTGYLLEKLLATTSRPLLYKAHEHSAQMANVLEERFGKRLLAFEIIKESVTAQNLLRYEAAEKYDLIIGSSILHHLPDYDSVVRHLAGMLKPGGVLYVVREPIHKDECEPATFIQNLLEPAYRTISAFLMRPWLNKWLWPEKIRAEDAREIAVHMFKDGVSMKPFSDLTGQGYRLVLLRKYNRRLTSFMSYLENKYLSATRKDMFGNTLFAIAIQRNR